ncbi:hypothetical protein, partial [Caballeronia sp. M23-90]
RLRLADLRSHIALVAQDTYLFNDTLEANIRLAGRDVSDADVRRGLVDGRQSAAAFLGSAARRHHAGRRRLAPASSR